MTTETKSPAKQKKPLIAKTTPVKQNNPLAAELAAQNKIIHEKWEVVNNILFDLHDAEKELNSRQTALNNKQNIYVLDKKGKHGSNEQERQAKLYAIYKHDIEKINEKKRFVNQLKTDLQIAENQLKEARETYKHLQNLVILDLAASGRHNLAEMVGK